MEDKLNISETNPENIRTSSSDGRNSKTSGDNQVQDGAGVLSGDNKEPNDSTEEQQEFLEQANNNTEVANKNPAQDTGSLTQLASLPDDEEDDDDDEDEDDDDGDIIPDIGDDPGDTKKKIPVM